MGFFFNIAIFSTLILKLFKKTIRLIIVVLLHIIMLASVSMTAILVNIGVWLIFIIISNNIKFKVIFAICVVVVVGLGAYSYGLKNPDAPILGAVSYRVEEKLSSLEADDLNSVTTGRVGLSESNLNYFRSSSMLKQLFGGTTVNMTYVDPALLGASHNEYVDLLLNVGFIGTALILLFLLWRLYDIWKKYKESKSDMYMSLLICKVIWLFYAGTLTVFLDYRFLLFYLF